MLCTTKLQSEWVKLLEKEDAKIAGCVHDGMVYISPDGFIAYAIPQCNFWLDMTKIKEQPVNRYFPLQDECYPLTYKEKRVIDGKVKKERIVHIFTDADGNEHVLDGKLLKPFEMGCRFWTKRKNSNSIVLITRDNIPVAVCMPIDMSKAVRK